MEREKKNRRTGGLAARAAGWGVLVFVGTAVVLLPVSWTQYRRNTADLYASTRVQTVETAVRLQQEIDHHLRLIALLRDNVLRDVEPITRFEREARAMTAAWPAFQAINWASPDGEILRVIPAETNRAALGMNVTDVAAAADAFRRARLGTELAATQPLDLRQGGRGVVVYLAVRRDGEVLGVINGVFRLDRLFSVLLGDGLLERYAIRVSDGDDSVYEAGDVATRFENAPATHVSIDERNWRIELAPRAERVANFGAQFREEIAGILALALLAGLLAALLGYKQMSLRYTELRFRELNRLLPDMVFECDEHFRITYLNRLAQEQLGYTDADVAAGLSLPELVGPEEMSRTFDTLREELGPDGAITRVCAVRCDDGSSTTCEATLGAIHDEAGRFRGVRAVLRDITERLEAERIMNRLANFDSTTQLPNRAMFLEVLDHEIRQAGAQRKRLTLMVVDLDNFKSINDRFGPSMGDLLLREAGQRLRDALNRQEYVFRLGGDEFAVLFDTLHTSADIDRAAQLLLATLRQPYRLRSGVEATLDATIGVSLFPGDANNAEQLYMHADAAVYEAKAEGGRRHRLFTHEISSRLSERKQMEEDLRRAADRGEFHLHYQPVIDVTQGGVIGLEALIRWQHPARGLLAPLHFVRLAEETGLIDEVGRWVLQEACRQLAAWDCEGLRVPQLAVNVSAHQLENGVLGADVRDALRDHGIAGDRLVLELTESLLMRDVHFAARTLVALKNHGVRTAVDDFGTGYSSLAYLHQLPIDTLKIDRAFVAPLARAGSDTRVTEAIIALARSLKLSIVAEGVETERQAQFLRAQGCDVMQGFLFSRAVSARDVAELLRRDWREKTATVSGERFVARRPRS